MLMKWWTKAVVDFYTHINDHVHCFPMYSKCSKSYMTCVSVNALSHPDQKMGQAEGSPVGLFHA